MPPSRQGGLVGEVQPGPYTGLMLYLGWALSLVAVYSEVCRPKLQNLGGLAPDVVGGELVWPQFRFFPFRAALRGRWG